MENTLQLVSVTGCNVSHSIKMYFNVPHLCSLFTVQCSMFNVYRSMFNAHCSMFNVQCSMFNTHCPMFNVRDNGDYIGVGVSYRLAGMLSPTPPSLHTPWKPEKPKPLTLIDQRHGFWEVQNRRNTVWGIFRVFFVLYKGNLHSRATTVEISKS